MWFFVCWKISTHKSYMYLELSKEKTTHKVGISHTLFFVILWRQFSSKIWPYLCFSDDMVVHNGSQRCQKSRWKIPWRWSLSWKGSNFRILKNQYFSKVLYLITWYEVFFWYLVYAFAIFVKKILILLKVMILRMVRVIHP